MPDKHEVGGSTPLEPTKAETRDRDGKGLNMERQRERKLKWSRPH